MGEDDTGLGGAELDCVVFDLDGTLTEVGTSRAFPGMAEVLARLTDAGVDLAVATSAPTAAAHRALAALDLARWFASVAGAAPNAGTTGKDTIVAEALLGLGRPLPEGARGVAVVGDGGGDMAAASRHGLVAVGVAWGRAPVEQLLEAGATVVVDEPAQLLPIVLADCRRDAGGRGAGGRSASGGAGRRNEPTDR